VATGRLVAVLEHFAAPPNGVYAVIVQRKHLPLRVRLWIDYLKQSYGDARYWSVSQAEAAETRIPTT
jgi:DNA-binding transcriptional LysR family regulator